MACSKIRQNNFINLKIPDVYTSLKSKNMLQTTVYSAVNLQVLFLLLGDLWYVCADILAAF